MHAQEVKAELSLDRLQLESVHKVRGTRGLGERGTAAVAVGCRGPSAVAPAPS